MLPGRLAGGVPGGDVAEDDGRADGGARSGVLASHHRRGGVAGRVEAVDERTVLPQNPAVLVADQPALRPEVTDLDAYGVEGRLDDLVQVGVLQGRVAVVAVVGAVAAAELGVLAGAGEAVEPLDGRGEFLGGNADGDGEFGDAVRPVCQAALVEFLGERHSGQDLRERVAGAGLGVHHEPGRYVTARQLVVDEVHVRGGLVGEAAAAGVDDHRRRDAPLGHQGDRGAGRVAHRGHPPRVVHEVQSGSEFQPGDDAVADVLPGAGAVVLPAAVGQVLLAHLLVVVEATGREQHTAPCPDAHLLAVALRDDAGHRAVVADDQAGHRGPQPHGDSGVLQGHPEPCHQRATAGGHVAAADHVGRDPPGGDDGRPASAPGALDHREVAVVLGGDPQTERALHVVGPLVPLVLAELAGVEGERLDGAAHRTAAVVLGVVVGVSLDPEEAHPPALAEQFHGGRTLVDVGVEAGGRDAAPGEAVEVLPDRRTAVVVALGAQRGVVGDPDAAAGDAGRTAVHLPLLDHDGGQAAVHGGQCGRHTATATADDDEVELVVPGRARARVHTGAHAASLRVRKASTALSQAAFCSIITQ